MEDRGALITAIFQYAKHQKIEIELSPLVKMAFSCIQDALDRDLEHYAEKCKQNAENGKKGGRPKKDIFLPKTEGFSEQPKKADKDKDTDKDTDTKSKTDMDRDRDRDTEFYSAPPCAPARATEDLCSAPPCAPARATEDLCSAPPSDLEPAPPVAAAPISDAAPPVTQEDRAWLLEKGIPKEYVNERLERAERYAASAGKSAASVLLEWWHRDRKERKWSAARSTSRAAPKSLLPQGLPTPGCSFDEDDFLQAALERSLQELAR